MRILSIKTNNKKNIINNYFDGLLLDLRYDSINREFIDYVIPRPDWNSPHNATFLYPVLDGDGKITEYSSDIPDISNRYIPYNRYFDEINSEYYYKLEDETNKGWDTADTPAEIQTYLGEGAIPPYWKIIFHNNIWPLDKSDSSIFGDFIRDVNCVDFYDVSNPFTWGMEYLSKIKSEGVRVLNDVDNRNWYTFLSMRDSDQCIDRIIVVDVASIGFRNVLKNILNFDERTEYFIKDDITHPEPIPNMF